MDEGSTPNTPDSGESRDLIMVSLPGVQQFIAESRSTSDVCSASQIVATLAVVAAQRCRELGAELIFPDGQPDHGGQITDDGMPNRVVALVPAGAATAAEAAAAVDRVWRQWVRQALAGDDQPVPATPGFPASIWVCAPAGPDGYAGQWHRAQRLLAARRQVRDFPRVEEVRRELCLLSPRWPAEPTPAGLRPHERDTLSAASWVKRRWRVIRSPEDSPLTSSGFPSTLSIASATFRAEVLARLGDDAVAGAVADLRHATEQITYRREWAVPGLGGPETSLAEWLRRAGGPAVHLGWWQAQRLAKDFDKAPGDLTELAERGRWAAKALITLMKNREVSPPTSYLAVLVQDLDGMGRYLAGDAPDAAGRRLSGLTPGAHREVSGRLGEVAKRQRAALETAELRGIPVYLGGDDLLAFTPAATALAAARRCYEAIGDDLPKASTAVLYFHHLSGLQDALTRVRHLLERAKKAPGKNRLAVGFRRRSGTAVASVQPWCRDGGELATEAFALFARDREYDLSPGLVVDLERDRAELATLQHTYPEKWRAELTRLVTRHLRGPGGGVRAAGERVAQALEWLGRNEDADPPAPSPRHATGRPGRNGTGAHPESAARVAVFLRQEVR